ncbi:SPW repeat domain-containing protein [Bradyrhizobium zhanjiangense]|nr:SPW repeat protein [Bradyrhizobium zhanjiangense]
MRIQHWQDAASLLVGLWLVLSSFILGLSGAPVWVSIALGLGVMLFAIEALFIPSYLEEWGEMLEMLLGLALLLAPWTIGYEPVSATVSSVLSGTLVILLAVWELMTDRDFSTWWHDRWHRLAG